MKIVCKNIFHALQKCAIYKEFSKPTDFMQNNYILHTVLRLKLPYQRFINLIIGTIIITVLILLPDPSIPCGDNKNQTFYLRTQKPEN